MNNDKEFKKLAKGMAWASYAGVVVFADVMFISMMWSHFPDAPILRGLAIFGSLAMAVSAVALPIGLEYWFSPGLQYWAAIAFTVADLALQSINLIVATGLSSATTPAWVVGLADFTPASPMIVALGWAIVLLLGDESKLRHTKRHAESMVLDRVKKNIMAQLDSPEMKEEYVKRAKIIMAQGFEGLYSGDGKTEAKPVSREEKTVALPTRKPVIVKPAPQPEAQGRLAFANDKEGFTNPPTLSK
jgi:hypothetical protein